MLVVNLDDNSAMCYGTVSHVQPSKPTAQQPDISGQTSGTVSHVQLTFNSQEDTMPEKMKIAEILRKEKVTCFTTVSPDGQITQYIVLWRMPSKALIDSLKPGDTLVTDPIARITQP